MNNFSDILDRNFPLWKIEMLFQTIKISKFWGGGGGSISPQPPYGLHLQCLQDSSVIEKCPDFTYSKGWTVCVSTRYNCGLEICTGIYWCSTAHTDRTWIFHPTCELLEIFLDACILCFTTCIQCILPTITEVNFQWENPDCATVSVISKVTVL